jgi:hypothetical protein
MPVPGALERPDGPRLELPHPQRGRRCTAVGLLCAITSTLPGNEGAAYREQRGRILDEDRERGQRPRGHEVMRPDPLPPSLSPGLDRLGVRKLQALDGSPQEGGLPTDALYESDAPIGKRDREHEPRKPTTRPKIGDSPRTPHLGQFEGDERISHVQVDTLRRIPHRRDRARLRGHEIKEQRQPVGGRRLQAVPVSELREPVRDLRGHGHGGMEAGLRVWSVGARPWVRGQGTEEGPPGEAATRCVFAERERPRPPCHATRIGPHRPVTGGGGSSAPARLDADAGGARASRLIEQG